MGKQIGFFMTHRDEIDFVSAIRQKYGPLEIISNTSRIEHEPVELIESAKIADSNLSLVRLDDLERVVTSYVTNQSVYCVDLLNSNVVQFNRCIQRNGWLAPGRLWFESVSNHGKKSHDFVKWANSILGWIKKEYARIDGYSESVGPDAYRRWSSGGLVLGPPK